jgi:anti-sigma factor RsiW
MANERQRRLMQESLDEQLSTEARQELYGHLDAHPSDADAYQRLREVDKTLRGAPYERAPRTMALGIFARLAEGLGPQPFSHISGLAVAAALAAVTLLLVPILLGLGVLFLSLIGSVAALNALIHAVAALLSLVYAVIENIAASAQTTLAANPQIPALVLALVPAGVIHFVRTTLARRSDEAAPTD